MMGPNKRKTYVSDSSDEDDSFNYRRSSLRVNLSHSENLTDSGNGSLKTEIKNNEKEADSIQTIRRLSRGKGTCEKKNRRSDPGDEDTRAKSILTQKCAINNDSEIPVSIKERVQLKRLTVNLEDISTKEQYLETSCKHLRNAILSKTKQIFDRDNELSVKTAMVLGNRDKCSASSVHNPNVENKTVVLDTTDHPENKAAEKCKQYTDTLNDRQRDRDSNIVATPTKSNEKRSLEKKVDKSRLTQRRLFVDKEEGQTKCRIIEDVILKKNLPLFSHRQANQSSSPILSGSNRRLSLLRARSKMHSQNPSENLNNTWSTVHSVQNLDIGMPVGCSTFIDDNAKSDKEINNDMSAACVTTNEVISMELTEIYSGIRANKEHTSLQNRNSNANNYNGKSKEEKFKEGSMKRNTNASNLEDIEHKKNITVRNNTAHLDLSCTDEENDQNASVHMDTVVPMQISKNATTKTRENEKRRTISLSDSNDTIRSSLNVNTSLDAASETNKARNFQRFDINHRTNNANQDFDAIINNKESVMNDNRESTNTIRTSLQMNMSVDSVCKTWRRKTDKDYKDRDHSNINKISRNDKLRISKIRDEDKRDLSNSGDSYSYVEATPYPISRSDLFKSHLKHKTQYMNDAATCSSNLSWIDKEEKNDKTKSFALHSKVGTQKTIETDTVTLKDTPSDNPLGNPFITQNQLTAIEDMPDETKSKTDERNAAVENAEYISVRKGRKRLLPIHQNSQCSISPIEERRCTAEKSTPTKQDKKLKKKLPRRKSMRSKTNTSNIERDSASKRMWSDSDCDISENKKKEKTKKKEKEKTRKPKKIISKKIVIKKYADENVLNILQRERDKENHVIENGDSLDDFVECRTISSQWNKHRSQKIVIVTTGLSKGDKSLVNSIVKSLGMAEIELSVSRRTTHVVSTGVRTVNLLRGIIRGCWLITLEWVLKSLENNAWLDPETFEMKHFSKAVQENRKDRQLFGFSYIPEVFAACGLIYIEGKTAIPCDTLKELIKTAGGHITENIKFAKIIIGANGLKETWVLDSITTGDLQLTKLYQRK